MILEFLGSCTGPQEPLWCCQECPAQPWLMLVTIKTTWMSSRSAGSDVGDGHREIIPPCFPLLFFWNIYTPTVIYCPFLLLWVTFLDAQRPHAAPWGAQLGVLSTELGSAPHSRNHPAAFPVPTGPGAWSTGCSDTNALCLLANKSNTQLQWMGRMEIGRGFFKNSLSVRGEPEFSAWK